jgi:hypothetical protein
VTTTSFPASISRLKVERRDLVGVRPTPLEVLCALDPRIGRAIEDEVVAQQPLDNRTITGYVGVIAGTG